MDNNPYAAYFANRPQPGQPENPFAQGLSNLLLQARMRLSNDPMLGLSLGLLGRPKGNQLLYNPFNAKDESGKQYD